MFGCLTEYLIYLKVGRVGLLFPAFPKLFLCQQQQQLTFDVAQHVKVISQFTKHFALTILPGT
jgi:hypothetical protein